MNDKISVALATDQDGFLSQECPACRKRFKAKFESGRSRPISFCPYCRHCGTDCWWTPEQAEYFAAAVGNRVVAPILDRFARDFNRSRRPGGLVSMSMSASHGPKPNPPVEHDEPMRLASFACCNERVKLSPAARAASCIICGESVTPLPDSE